MSVTGNPASAGRCSRADQLLKVQDGSVRMAMHVGWILGRKTHIWEVRGRTEGVTEARLSVWKRHLNRGGRRVDVYLPPSGCG